MYSRVERKKVRSKVRRRIRGKVRGSGGRPRLSVFRSGRHMYAQAIDDETGATVASASTIDDDCRSRVGESSTGGIDAARIVGSTIAERLTQKGVTSVVFDRGGFRYHGRIKALADAAREGGLEF
jgi:large subunit ribosomal protein L18